ncbi:MAG: rotamase [Phenylobacterium sp.]|uniref:peptidylprolyl isomerase n=1 Tax=Phenylobacterium sp. TaxID=1871053 RepID=UPI0025D3BB50|nr:peptidylprolyl isomerase [Phenylobacterium sp.]MBI1199103.1 rotamase [Phenylobacterium sp.]
MLSATRNFAKSWAAKALLALLILAMAGFGITRYGFQAVGGNEVIKAGSRTVDPLAFRREYDNYKKRFEQQSGQTITQDIAEQNHLDAVVMNGLATREAFAALMTKIGIRPSDKQIVGEIEKIPAFFDPVSGRFDKTTYQRRLGDNGLTPAAFDAILRDEMAGQQWQAAIQHGLAVPRTYSALAAIFALEARDLTYFTITPQSVPQPPTPTDAQLKAFINENKSQLTVPELRVLTVVQFSQQAAAAAVSAAPIDPAELKKRYDFRKDTLSRPETRTVIQIPAKTQAEAQKAVERLRQGDDPDAIAKSLGVQAITFTDKPLTAISDHKVGQAAFKMQAGEVSSVQGDLGLAAVKVASINPGHEVTLEEARPMLEAEIRKDMIAEKVYAQTQAYDDAHQAGANLTDAAQKAGVEAKTYPAVNEQGVDEKGQRFGELDPKILQTAFALPAGGESEVTELGDGAYYAVRVEKIEPAHVPPLDEIRPQLTRFWMQRELIRQMDARAKTLIGRIEKGESLEAVAKSEHYTVARVEGLTRQTAGQHQELGRDVLGRTFSAKAGEAWSAPGAGGLIVAQVGNVKMDAGPTAAQLAEAGRRDLTMALARDLDETARTYARSKMKVVVHPDRARSALGFAPLEDQTPTPEKKG